MNRLFWSSCITILLLGGTLATSKVVDFRPPEALARPLDSIDTGIDGWTGVENPPIAEKILKELVPTSYLSRTYHRGNESVDLFISYYANQRAGESMHSPKHCLPGAGWEIWDYGKTDIVVNGRRIQVNKHRIQKEESRMAVLYWYQSRRRIIASEYSAKLLLVQDALIEHRTGGAIVRIMVTDTPGMIQAGESFAATLVPLVQRCLGERPQSN